MMYVIGETKNRHSEYREVSRYSLYDTITDSVCYVSRHILPKMLTDSRFEIINATFVNKEIVIKSWAYPIATVEARGRVDGAYFVLLNKDENNRYKTVNCMGQIKVFDSKIMADLVNKGEVANCIMDAVDDKIHIYDTYKENIRNIELEKEVAKKYARFMLKSRAIGLDISFEYEIDGDRVKIIDYLGTSKVVTIPNFITDITRSAFEGCNIESVALNTGLKRIGVSAFEDNSLRELEIPNTVELVGTRAFGDNESLLVKEQNGFVRFKRETVSILGKNTILLNQGPVTIAKEPKNHGKITV